MRVIKCRNGHFFDVDTYATCPHCGEAAMTAGDVTPPAKEEKKSIWGRRKTKHSDVQTAVNITPVAPVNDEKGDLPTEVMEPNIQQVNSTPPLKKNPTLDFWQTSAHSQSEFAEKEENKETVTEEENNKAVLETSLIQEEIKEEKNEVKAEEPKMAEATSSLLEAVKNASARDEGKTMSYFSSATGATPAAVQQKNPTELVVGWLVCISGCRFGEDFNIYVGKNSIGRGEENRIIISDDKSISRSKHATIVYEPKKRNFYLQPGDSSGLTYLNDDYITESHKLTKNDIIELGDSRFMFIPLCGEEFSWEEYMPKGE